MLEAHPDVRQAVVVGDPDELMGERVAAFVEADAGVRPRRVPRVVRANAASRGSRRPSASSSSTRSPLLPTGKPDRAALRRARRSQGEVSTPIIWKPLITAFGFRCPGFQS